MKQKYPEKKITTYVRSLSASAGYWLSVSSDKIYSSPVSIIGSIGVRTGHLPDLSEFVKDHKIKFTTFQAGRFKTMGDPMRPLTEEETAIIQENIDDCYQMFTDIIQTRRGDRLDKTDPDLFSGLTWRAPVALKKGLIDYCDVSFEDMIKAEYGDYHYSYVKPKDSNFSLSSFIKELRESLLCSVKILGSATSFSNQTLYA
jgi:ClpP class serine protease